MHHEANSFQEFAAPPPTQKKTPAQWRRVPRGPTKRDHPTPPRYSLRHNAEAFPHPAQHLAPAPPTPPILNPRLPAPPRTRLPGRSLCIPCRFPMRPRTYNPRATAGGWLRPGISGREYQFPLRDGNFPMNHGTERGRRHRPAPATFPRKILATLCSDGTRPDFPWKVLNAWRP